VNFSQCLCPWLVEPLKRIEAAAAAERLGHAWLISGPTGVGKINFAYTLADRLLNRQVGADMPAAASPKWVLASYAQLDEAADLHPDLHRVRRLEDKHTIAISQIRDMTSALALTPHIARCKVVIIEAADTMTTEAANALLKSLEEPTPNTFLLLLAARPGRLPGTIRSRCQRLRLRVPSPDTMSHWLRTSDLNPQMLTPEALPSTPIVAAALLGDEDEVNKYKELQSNIRLIYEGKADTLALAEAWAREPAAALDSLIRSVRSRIRQSLLAGPSTRVTERAPYLTENRPENGPDMRLFATLQMAENLREELGRGINVELALASLLLGLASPSDQRVR